jgi:hypothetical protein
MVIKVEKYIYLIYNIYSSHNSADLADLAPAKFLIGMVLLIVFISAGWHVFKRHEIWSCTIGNREYKVLVPVKVNTIIPLALYLLN